FAEVREYQPGDDIRDIDWNVTARFDRPYVKVFEEERELTVMLVVDLSGSQYFGTVNATKRQIAVEISAILAFSALKNNDKVGLIIFSDKIEKFVPPKKSRSHALRIIRELLSFEPEGKGTDVNSALEFLNKAHKKRAIVFLISDFNDDGYDRSLRIVGKRHDLIGVEISDEREQTIPRIGLARFRDPETGREEVVDAGSKSFLTFYRKRKRELRESRQRLFNTSRLDRISVNTRDSYISPLVGFFRTRGKRW
ncbi:MAG: DUF58 domain-containing protein, partial [Ignavibacteriales bacterium]|nr:DUF58 domain-containing protein [Ignavibacteriales bacterium]